jgi:hypothetical protein
MNPKLTEEIAHHILANLGVLPSSFMDYNQSKSVMDKQFLLPEKLAFETEEGQVLQRNLYGCQISVTDAKEFKLLLADCTQEKEAPEYALVVQLKDAPVFGVYLVSTRSTEIPSEPLIGVNADKKYWIPCTTYLEATFLAGMEQLKDLGFGWSKCKSYQDLHHSLLEFIKFHTRFYGTVTDEGQED